MSKETKKNNHQKLYRYVTKYTAAFWGQSFVKELQRVTDEIVLKKVPRLVPERYVSTLLRSPPFIYLHLLLLLGSVVANFKKSRKKKIFLLDYDGTLTSLHKLPEFAKPTQALLTILRRLCSLPNVFVYILSGRPREYLDRWFKDLEIGKSAEHGCFFKHPPKFQEFLDSAKSKRGGGGGGLTGNGGTSVDFLQRVSSSSSMASSSGGDVHHHRRQDTNSWFALVDQVDSSWRNTILPLFQHYTERTPGSFIEEKEINITWHYRNADPEFGIWQATELQVNLEKILSHLPVSIILGNKTLELRPSSIDKATAAKAILSDLRASQDADFLLCIGDGKNDEGLFSLLTEPWQTTVTVGKKRTEAHYFVESVRDVEMLITELSNCNGDVIEEQGVGKIVE